MANPKHLEILKKGSKYWNQWRKENPKIEPDLNKANLREANLRYVNLGRADLIETRLSKANLGSANLIRANLSGAVLSGANLKGAKLSGATLAGVDFRGADLSEANLREANLRGAILIRANLGRAKINYANLTKANLKGADFSESYLGNTIFTAVDLSKVVGLKTCNHDMPSFIDQTTLIRSGNLPEVFLKGCGFPDSFIEYLPSLLGSLKPIDFYSCFISHSVKDEKFAKQLHSDLQAAGIRCWYAPKDLKTGQKIRKEIHEAIRIHDKLLLVLSKNSISSDWVEEEVETAIQQEANRRMNNQGDLVLFPIRLDDAVIDSKVAWAEVVRNRQIGDFRKWKNQDSRKEAFKLLLRDLKNESNQ